MNTELDNLQNADGEQQSKSVSTNDFTTESYKTEEAVSQEKISDISFKDYETFSFDVLINEAKNLLSKHSVQEIREHFNQIKDAFKQKLDLDEASKKEAFLNESIFCVARMMLMPLFLPTAIKFCKGLFSKPSI